jgi:hypothetical protein
LQPALDGNDWTLSLLLPFVWSLADIERWIPVVLLLLFADSLPESRLLLPNKRPHLLVRIVVGRWPLVVTATRGPAIPLLPWSDSATLDSLVVDKTRTTDFPAVPSPALAPTAESPRSKSLCWPVSRLVQLQYGY